MRPSRCASSPAARGGRIRWRTRFARPMPASERDRHPRRGAAVRERGPHRADDCGGGGVGRGAGGAAGARHGEARPMTVRADSRTPRTRCVDETMARETIFLAQTPQAFRRDVLPTRSTTRHERMRGAPTRRRWPSARVTPVRLVEGEASNIKITTPEDLPLAEAIAGRAPIAGERDRPRRHRLRSAPARRRAAARSRRRHDSVRPRARSVIPTPTSSATR